MGIDTSPVVAVPVPVPPAAADVLWFVLFVPFKRLPNKLVFLAPFEPDGNLHGITPITSYIKKRKQIEGG